MILLREGRLGGAGQGMSKADQHRRRWLCFSTSSAAEHARDQELGGREGVYGDME